MKLHLMSYQCLRLRPVGRPENGVGNYHAIGLADNYQLVFGVRSIWPG